MFWYIFLGVTIDCFRKNWKRYSANSHFIFSWTPNCFRKNRKSFSTKWSVYGDRHTHCMTAVMQTVPLPPHKGYDGRHTPTHTPKSHTHKSLKDAPFVKNIWSKSTEYVVYKSLNPIKTQNRRGKLSSRTQPQHKTSKHLFISRTRALSLFFILNALQ